ncbi:unnamed protein product [Caenorhabditis brenneri]
MRGVILFATLFNFSKNFYPGEACMATSPTRPATSTAAPITTSSAASTVSTTSAMSTSSSTTAPALRTCSQDAVTLGQGDGMDPEVLIDVTSSNFMSTQIGDTQETLSTMQISCSAIDGLIASMQLDGMATPRESMQNTQTVTVNFECNSADMVWQYVVTINGVEYSRNTTSVICRQATGVAEG